MGTHLTVLSESFPINTNMTEFRWFSKTLRHCALNESNLSIGGGSKKKAPFPDQIYIEAISM